MATRTISTRIAIEGEAEYKKSVANINSELKTLKSELSLVESQYRSNANSMEALRTKGDVLSKMYETQDSKVKSIEKALQGAQQAQQTYAARVEECKTKIAAEEAELQKLADGAKGAKKAQEELSAALAQHRKELEEATARQEAATKGVNDWQRQLNYAKRDLSDLNGEISKNRKYFDEAAASADGCASSIDKLGKETKEAGEQADGFGDQSTGAIEGLASALAAAGVAAAVSEIAAALRECVTAASEFEGGMAEVFTLLPGLSEVSREKLKADMLGFSSDMNVLTTEAVPALYQAISAGVPSDHVFSFMETAQKAAIGGVTDLKTSVDGLTSIVNAYGEGNITAEETADALFTAVRLGKTNFEELSGSIYNVVPIAASAQVSFSDIAAALAAITARGTPTRVATTQLRQALAELTKSGSEVDRSFQRLAGESFTQFIAKGGNLQGALQLLEEEAKRSGVSISNMFGSVEAGQAALSLTGNATAKFSEALSAMENSAGAVDAAYETMADTADFQFQRLQVSMEGVKVAIGDAMAPAFQNMASAAADGLSWVDDLLKKCPWLVQAITGLIAALGVLVTGVTAFTAVTAVGKKVVDAFGAALEGTFGNVLIIATALTAAITIIGAFTAYIEAANSATAGWSEATKAAVSDWEKQSEEIDKNAKSAVQMTAALKELTEKEQKTAADKQAILGLVRELNEAVPELSLAYDEQTDSLNMTADAIERVVMAQREQEQIENTQDALAALYAEREDLSDQIIAAAEKVRAAEEKYAEFDGVEAKTRREVEAINYASSTLSVAQSEYERLTQQKKINEEQTEALKTAYEQEIGTLEQSGDAVDTVAAKLRSLSNILGNVKGGYDMLSKAEKEMAESGYLSLDTVSELLTKYPELSGYLVEASDGYKLADGALQDYMAAQRAEYQLAYDNAATAAQAIIDAEIAKGTQIDVTTQSVKEQLKALALLYQTNAKVETFGADWKNSDEYLIHGNNALSGNESYKKSQDYMNAYNELDAAERDMGTYKRTVSSLGRDTGSGKKSSGGSNGGSNKKEETQAERDLKTYRDSVKELDHERAMERISEEEYYQRKANLGELYLKENKEERQRLDEELYQYQKGAYDRELAELDKRLKNEEISLQEHLSGLAEIQKKYQTEGSDEWRENEARQAEDRKAMYDQKLATAKYLRDMDVTDDQQYYIELSRLQTEYLEAGSEEYKAVEVEIHDYIKKCREESLREAEDAYKSQLKALETALDEQMTAEKERYNAAVESIKTRFSLEKKALKRGYDDNKAAAKAAYEEKKAGIKRELALEKERLNTIIEGIDAEVQARKELREDEEQDDKIAAAQKKLEAAKAQRGFARSDEDKKQWDNEIIRAQEALAEAIKSKEDTEFYRRKDEEKAAVQEQIKAAEDVADAAMEAAEKSYNAAVKKLESEYNLNLDSMEARYQSELDAAKANYERQVAQLKADYEEREKRLEDRLVEKKEWINQSDGAKPATSDVNEVLRSAPQMASTAAAIVGTATSAMVSNVTKNAQSVVKNANASVTINQASSLTQGQVANTVRKVLNGMWR